jgi:phage tail-like protein
MALKNEFQLQIKGPEGTQEFTVPIGTTIIGRDASAGLQLLFPLISRRHAQINCTETDCEILDLESANGTIVGGEKLSPNKPAKITEGTVIEIGPFEITCKVTTVQDAPLEPKVEQPPPVQEPEQAPVEKAPAEKAPSEKVEKVQEAKPAKKAPKAAAEKGKGKEAPPPPPPPSKPEVVEPSPEPLFPPGLSTQSMRLLSFLPGIYHTDFMSRFLALFESILIPIEWNVDNFYLYLDSGTSPMYFLPWLANWYQISFDDTWSEEKRRMLLREAHLIYGRRGTRWALGRVLEIYTGQKPEIIEFEDERYPFTFTIRLPVRRAEFNQELIEQIVDTSKPSHTTYKLEFTG